VRGLGQRNGRFFANLTVAGDVGSSPAASSRSTVVRSAKRWMTTANSRSNATRNASGLWARRPRSAITSPPPTPRSFAARPSPAAI